MDPLILIKAAILGVVEGLTEFLPVSSTGHLILAGQLLGFTGEKAKLFEIVIQGGAIFAVCVEYRARFLGALAGITHDRAAQRFWINLAIAFVPLAALGLLFNKMIKAALFKPVPVAIAFISGAGGHELPWGPIMAASVMVTLPLILLVMYFQRLIVAGLTAGAVKG